MGLSPKEEEGLINRPTNAHERATNDVRVRKKLAAWLKEFDDMTEIFLCLPPEQLRKELSDIHVHRLSFFLITAMDVLNFHPIVGEIDKPDDWKTILDVSANRFEMLASGRAHYRSRAAENEDITRTLLLVDAFNELNLFFGNNNPVVEAVQLEKLEDDPKLRSRLTDGERRGIERVNLALNTEMDAVFGEKDFDFVRAKGADDTQWKEDVEAKREMRKIRASRDLHKMKTNQNSHLVSLGLQERLKAAALN